MAPLSKLLKKGQEFLWETEQKEAFQKAKDSVTREPTLAQHDPTKPTTIETDASDYAIGMVMTQPGPDGKARPIAFHSRKLVQAELNYDIHDKELLAIVVAFKTWRVYVDGAQHAILIKTDHKNLTFFTTTKKLTRRQARSAEVLSQYDFKVVHCRGDGNGKADALSRRPDYEIKDKTVNSAILRKIDDESMSYNHPILAATIQIQDEPLMNRIIGETKKDQMIQEMVENSEEIEKLTTDDNEIVYMHGLIYVPKSMRTKILTMHHDTPLHGHMGIEKTAEQIARNYYFPNLWKTVRDYVKNCEVCIQDKPARHQPYGKMQSPDAPTRPWEWVTIQFYNPVITIERIRHNHCYHGSIN